MSCSFFCLLGDLSIGLYLCAVRLNRYTYGHVLLKVMCSMMCSCVTSGIVQSDKNDYSLNDQCQLSPNRI